MKMTLVLFVSLFSFFAYSNVNAPNKTVCFSYNKNMIGKLQLSPAERNVRITWDLKNILGISREIMSGINIKFEKGGYSTDIGYVKGKDDSYNMAIQVSNSKVIMTSYEMDKITKISTDEYNIVSCPKN